jgi:hypothetical protein
MKQAETEPARPPRAGRGNFGYTPTHSSEDDALALAFGAKVHIGIFDGLAVLIEHGSP